MLNRMLIENLKAQETEAIEAAKDDPTALQRYRALQTRRRQLELNSPSTAQSQD
jgi:DNA primase